MRKHSRVVSQRVEQPLSNQASEPDHAFDLYIEHQKQAWADCQSGSDEYDKSILTYSSAGLALSLAFIKDIVPLGKADALFLLYGSWIAFGIAIVVTVISFQLSVMAQEIHLNHLRKYYLDGQSEFLHKRIEASLWVGRCKWISGTFFIAALVGTIVFAIWNVSEAHSMSDKNTAGPSTQKLHEGRGLTPLTPLRSGPVGQTQSTPSPSPSPPSTDTKKPKQ